MNENRGGEKVCIFVKATKSACAQQGVWEEEGRVTSPYGGYQPLLMANFTGAFQSLGFKY